MKEKCDGCEKITDLTYILKREDYVFGFQLKFCWSCGEHLEDFGKTLSKGGD